MSTVEIAMTLNPLLIDPNTNPTTPRTDQHIEQHYKKIKTQTTPVCYYYYCIIIVYTFRLVYISDFVIENTYLVSTRPSLK